MRADWIPDAGAVARQASCWTQQSAEQAARDTFDTTAPRQEHPKATQGLAVGYNKWLHSRLCCVVGICCALLRAGVLPCQGKPISDVNTGDSKVTPQG
jgi:hypothetical protein